MRSPLHMVVNFWYSYLFEDLNSMLKDNLSESLHLLSSIILSRRTLPCIIGKGNAYVSFETLFLENVEQSKRSQTF